MAEWRHRGAAAPSPVSDASCCPSPSPVAFARQPSQDDAFQMHVLSTLDALLDATEAHSVAMEFQVAQATRMTDLMTHIARQLDVLLPQKTGGFASHAPEPLTPVFSAEPEPEPLERPPSREMRPWEQSALQRWLKSERLSQDAIRGVFAILNALDSGGELFVDVRTYNSVTQWQLWHFLKYGLRLEDVMTAEEAADVHRKTERSGKKKRTKKPVVVDSLEQRMLKQAQASAVLVKRAAAIQQLGV